MEQYPTAPQNVFQLVGSCIANYWPVLRSTWQTSLTISLLYFVTNSVAQINKWVGIGLLAPGLLLVLLLNGIFWVKTHGALGGQQIKFLEAMTRVKPRYLAMLGTAILLVLIITGVASAVFGIGYLLKMVFHAPDSILILLGCGGLVLLLALFIYLYFPVLLVLLDNSRVLPSFKTSYQLVRHHWWHTFWVLFITSLLIFLVNLILTSLLSMIFMGDSTSLNYTNLNAAPLSGIPLIIVHVIEILFTAIFYPAIFTIVLLIFNDLKLRRKWSSRINL